MSHQIRILTFSIMLDSDAALENDIDPDEIIERLADEMIVVGNKFIRENDAIFGESRLV